MVPNRCRRSALGFALAALPACDTATGPALPDGPPVVTVDFAQPVVSARSMVGFLHGIQPHGPADSMIAPLRPALWRASNQLVGPRATGFGARFVFVLSDHWGYPVSNWRQPPYQDWAAWEAFVRDIARRTRGQPVIYDIWNEPDNPEFWRGSDAQFYDTFRRAERVLREELGPNVQVAGPGYAHWSESKINEFLRGLRTRGGRLDVLAWHEFPDEQTMPGIRDHLQTARRRFLGSSGFTSLGIREIQVHEVGSLGLQYQPTSALAALYFLEAGGADAAARTCWGSSCWDTSLGGLLTPAGEPRAVWWAYRSYAATLAGRVPSASSDPRLVTFATRGSAGQPAQVVVAHYELRTNSPPLDVTLELAGLRVLLPPSGSGELRVRVSRIPPSGEQPLLALPVLADTVVAVHPDSMLRLPLPALPVHEARVITFEPHAPSGSRSRARG